MTKKITQIGLVASLYVVATLAIHPFGYGPIQLRIGEILVLLCFFDKKYCWSLIIGCFIANLLSPYGPLDLMLGTAHTAISVLLITQCKKLWIAGFMPVIPCFLIGFAIVPTFSIGMLIATAEVMLCEFVTVVGVGVPIFYWISRNKKFMSVVSS